MFLLPCNLIEVTSIQRTEQEVDTTPKKTILDRKFQIKQINMIIIVLEVEVEVDHLGKSQKMNVRIKSHGFLTEAEPSNFYKNPSTLNLSLVRRRDNL